MAGAIEKKKNETYDELVGSPATHIDARSSILSDIALSREFAQTYLQALCKKFTSSSGNYSLNQICQNLAEQRAICYGARGIKNQVQEFNLPAYETVNGALDLTEANTSFFGYVATTLDGKNTINLQTGAGTQTIDGNTFSTQVSDYYMVRSRVSGELETTSGNISAYTTPDGGDIVFGNAVAWGSSVAGEEEANTWNYHWARANVASVTVKNPSNNFKLNTLTLADHLTQGSNTDYTPVGPGFNQVFYLKRHVDAVNTFTITGTTSVNSVSITGVSEADLAKVKHGDVISGTGIPDDNVTILAVQTEKNTIRLTDSGTATAVGTVTLTVNSVPVGHAAHDIFCEVKVSAEGLVANTTWAPVGDGNGGGLSDQTADDLCVADTGDFKSLLSFFNPDSPNNDLTKGASASYASDGKEYGGTSYPDIADNIFFPSNQGTSKAFVQADVADKGITGTQPSPLQDKDIWCGRFVRFDFERATNTGAAAPEFRYFVDNAEKFFYELPSTIPYTCGTVTVGATHAMPNMAEPPIVITKTGLNQCVDAINGATSIVIPADGTTASVTAILGTGGPPIDTFNSIPEDSTNTDDMSPTSGSGHATLGWSDDPPSSGVYASYYTIENNYIVKNDKHAAVTITPANADGNSPSHAWSAVLTEPKAYYQCSYNFAQRLMYDNGGGGTGAGEPTASQNTNNEFIADTVNDLKDLKSFRDPITTGTAATGSTGITDAAFDSYLTNLSGTTRNQWETSHDAFNSYLAGIRSTLSGQNRAGNDNGGTGETGDEISYSDTARVNWTANNTGIKDAAGKRVIEIDKRIGKPTRVGGGAGLKAFPTGRVSAIEASPATGEFVPYGRSIYNACNHLLGQHVDLLGGIIKDIESLGDLVDMVKTARNKYEIYSGRDTAY